MTVDQKTLEIMAAFQNYIRSQDSTGIEQYTVTELLHADESLGNRDLNDSFRLALRNRIKYLESNSEKKYQSLVRTIGYIVAFVAGVLSTLLAGWLSK